MIDFRADRYVAVVRFDDLLGNSETESMAGLGGASTICLVKSVKDVW